MSIHLEIPHVLLGIKYGVRNGLWSCSLLSDFINDVTVCGLIEWNQSLSCLTKTSWFCLWKPGDYQQNSPWEQIQSLDWWKAKATANSQNWIQEHVAFDGLRTCHRSQWSRPVVKICGILVPQSWHGIIDAQPRGLFTLGQLSQRLYSRKWSSPCDSYMVTLLDSFS